MTRLPGIEAVACEGRVPFDAVLLALGTKVRVSSRSGFTSAWIARNSLADYGKTFCRMRRAGGCSPVTSALRNCPPSARRLLLPIRLF